MIDLSELLQVLARNVILFNMKRVFILLLFFWSASLIFSEKAYAVFANCTTGAVTQNFLCLEDIYQSLIQKAVAGGVIVFFVMILSGGIKWLTSSGDPKDIENAKGRITFAVFGLFFLIVAWFILWFIAFRTFTTGAAGPITIFEIPR